MTIDSFWSRKARELAADLESGDVERYRDILPYVDALARLEREGTAVPTSALEILARKIVDEWPFDDAHGVDMLGRVQAAREASARRA